MRWWELRALFQMWVHNDLKQWCNNIFFSGLTLIFLILPLNIVILQSFSDLLDCHCCLVELVWYWQLSEGGNFYSAMSVELQVSSEHWMWEGNISAVQNMLWCGSEVSCFILVCMYVTWLCDWGWLQKQRCLKHCLIKMSLFCPMSEPKMYHTCCIF